MKLSALALWIGLGAMVGACAPTDAGGQRNPADFNYDWVVYDDDSGEISALTTGLTPEVALAPLEGERGVIVTGTRDAGDILDDEVEFPEDEGGISQALMTSDDLAFFLAAVSRWVDEDLGVLVAEDEEGEVREWMLED